MAFSIGSDVLYKNNEAQQLPSVSVGSNGCWLKAGPKNEAPVYISSIKGGVYDDRVTDSNKGRITLLPGNITRPVYPSNLNEIWVVGKKGDVISWAVS